MENLLFTGGSGFLGNNIRPVLDLHYDVTTCGISPDDGIKANLAKEIPQLDKHYDIVLHACGKAHVVPKTEAEKQAFFDVNYHGTVNLCSALEKVGTPRSLVFISTVAVYGCESGELITEELSPRDGHHSNRVHVRCDIPDNLTKSKRRNTKVIAFKSESRNSD